MEEKIFMARVAEQAERFEDMVEFLTQVIDGKDSDFSTEERNLFSVGFKNLIGVKRTAIRTIAAIEQNPKYSKYGEALGGMVIPDGVVPSLGDNTSHESPAEGGSATDPARTGDPSTRLPGDEPPST